MAEYVPIFVAPLVGAWIEILLSAMLSDEQIVAPLVGAWIEIEMRDTGTYGSMRRSPRGSVD